MLHSYRAELLKLRKRPAAWVLCGVWLALMMTFTYLFPYLSYRSASTPLAAARLLADLVPSRVPAHAITGYPMWGGALILALGALSTGSEYGWGTVKTMLSNRPGRLTVYGAQLLALATGVAALVAVAFALSGAASVAIASTANASMDSPAVADVARSMGAGWLILVMWCLLGVALGTVLRGTALSIGLGLIWVMAIENLIRSTSGLVAALGQIEKGLPGVNAGSLVAALGASGSGSVGIAPVVSGSQAVWVVAAYLVAFGVAGALVLRRRDVL